MLNFDRRGVCAEGSGGRAMTSRGFCYWLQGFFEVSGASALTDAQAEIVKRHLALVFKHEIDPSAGDAKHQTVLNEIHNPPWDGTIRC